MVPSQQYEIVKLSEIADFKTGRLNANAAVEGGEYPFFTCSRESFRTNTWSFDCECVLLAGNNANAEYPVKYFKGKFDAYQRTYVITAKDSKSLNIRYLYYCIELKLNLLKSLSTGSATRFLTKTILDNLEFHLPDKKVQDNIVDNLSSYDNLIENNNRRIAILEEMAQSLYREWFVYFRYPGHANQPDGSSDNEDNKPNLIDSPLGPIPEGWEVTSLGDLVHFKRNTIKKGTIPELTPYMGLEHFPRKSIALSEWEEVGEIGSNKLAFSRGDILFGKIRPNFHKVGVAQVNGLCSSDTFVLSPKLSAHHSMISMVTFSDEFVAQAVQTSQGSKMPRASWDVLKDFPVYIPELSLLEKFNAVVEPAIEQVRILSLKNRNLKKQRDMLLPKLISGDIEL